ncbi:uncharacterized protein LOC108024451 [Drosophila biarmipes]|uniref:uncharacterized protein LOC108024451 n=1 Tax=Drosophila biarmipes TaxID=125945 RepID=UPI0007E6CC37|nr:uncharacterized protein LOC108024451 [Drosophila biarmipes]
MWRIRCLILPSLMLSLMGQTVQGASHQCKSTEILSENGCVDREYFLNRIILRSWKDQGFQKAKARAGLLDEMKCKENEIRTPFGCSKPPFPPRRESERVEVHHSRLEHNQVVHDGAGFKEHHPDQLEEKKPVRRRRKREPGLPITGHNRPRSYVFLPGRTRTRRHKCRANEVLGRRSRCIKKRRATRHHKNKEKTEETATTAHS